MKIILKVDRSLKELPYLKEVISLCLIVIGFVSIVYPITEERVRWDIVSLNPPYYVPYYYEVTVYPFRNFGLILMSIGLLFLLALIITNKLKRKKPL
jgi:hypothetical protein